MLKCRELSQLVASDAAGELGFMKRMELRLHIMMCGHCRRYVQQLRTMGQGARDLFTGGGTDAERLRELEERILEQVLDDDK